MGNLLACSVVFGSWHYGCDLPHRRGVHIIVVRSSGSLSSSACPLAEVSPRLVMVDMVELVIVDVVRGRGRERTRHGMVGLCDKRRCGIGRRGMTTVFVLR